MSINSSLCGIGITASPFCPFYASCSQQMMPSATVHTLMSQAKYLHLLKKYGTLIKYLSCSTSGPLSVSVLVISDPKRRLDDGQFSFFAGLLFGPFEEGSLFYTLSWSSQKWKRPVKSIGAAKILAASESIDEGKCLKRPAALLFGIDISIIIALDSRDLYTSLSTQRNSIDNLIRADINVLRYEFETKNVNEMVWIPGCVILTDTGIKTDSRLIADYVYWTH